MLPGLCRETPLPGCEPRESFPHWNFTSGSSAPPNWPPRRTPGLWANMSTLHPEGGFLENGSYGGEGICRRKKMLKISRAPARSGSGAAERKANGAVKKRSSKLWIRPFLTLWRRQGRELPTTFCSDIQHSTDNWHVGTQKSYLATVAPHEHQNTPALLPAGFSQTSCGAGLETTVKK